MPTAYAFTAAQLDQIRQLRGTLSSPENRTTPSASVPLYSYVFQCITGLEVPQSTPLDFLTQPFVSGVLAALPADQRASAIWLYGAIQVNSDNGVFSEVIRQYNVHQGELRGMGEFSASQLQHASNQVGILFASSILEGILEEDVWLSRSGNHLLIDLMNDGGQMRVNNWYSSPNNRIEELHLADGQRLLAAQVDLLVQAMASFAPPAMGQTTLTPAQQASLSPVIAANWN